MTDVRTLGTTLDAIPCDECGEHRNDLARYEHPHRDHRTTIACRDCAVIFMADALREVGA